MSGAPDRFDVLVCGGGMVGASLAAALAPLALRVGLVEAVPFGSPGQPSFDERTIALSRSGCRILAGVGAWDAVAPHARPIRTIHVSERGRFGTAVISAAEQGVPELGHVVASRALGAALWERVARAPNVELLCPATAAAPAPGAEGVTVRVAAAGAEREAVARLLVVADGARSALRAALGIAARERSYDQVAIVGNVAVAGAPDPCTAWERFTPEGPLALLPWVDGRYAFVMALRPDRAQAAMALDDAAFLAGLQAAFGARLGRFERLGRRTAYPLSLVRAERVTASRAVLVGNAAHGLHPVAGQGYNLGLRDVAALAELVADAVRAGEDPGSRAVAERYAAWRRADQRNVVAFTDGLVRLFGVPLPAAGTARGLGLALFDALPGAKRALARHAMGMGGRLTRLARGLPL